MSQYAKAVAGVFVPWEDAAAKEGAERAAAIWQSRLDTKVSKSRKGKVHGGPCRVCNHWNRVEIDHKTLRGDGLAKVCELVREGDNGGKYEMSYLRRHRDLHVLAVLHAAITESVIEKAASEPYPHQALLRWKGAWQVEQALAIREEALKVDKYGKRNWRLWLEALRHIWKVEVDLHGKGLEGLKKAEGWEPDEETARRLIEAEKQREAAEYGETTESTENGIRSDDTPDGGADG